MGMDPMAMAQAGVAAGAVTQIVARSIKFSLFDSSKEVRRTDSLWACGYSQNILQYLYKQGYRKSWIMAV